MSQMNFNLAVLLLVALFAVCKSSVVAKFPLQFSANLTITAHQIAEESEYPPRVRRMTIYYDYENLRARAELEEGYEAAKVYIRRYDQKNEYMIRLPPINDCKRSFLNEIMPFPLLPPETEFLSVDEIDGVQCNYFLYREYESRIHMYISKESGAPVRLIQESTENGVSTPMLTYDYSDVQLVEPEAALFELPSPTAHDDCTRHVGGFPYLHVFHYFVKF